MTDYLKKLDDMISEEQKANFERKRYCEGYFDALATIRYAIRGMLEEREKDSEVSDV